jgi:hypothetical protein
MPSVKRKRKDSIDPTVSPFLDTNTNSFNFGVPSSLGSWSYPVPEQAPNSVESGGSRDHGFYFDFGDTRLAPDAARQQTQRNITPSFPIEEGSLPFSYLILLLLLFSSPCLNLFAAHTLFRLPSEVSEIISKGGSSKVATLLMLITHLHKEYKISIEEKGIERLAEGEGMWNSTREQGR